MSPMRARQEDGDAAAYGRWIGGYQRIERLHLGAAVGLPAGERQRRMEFVSRWAAAAIEPVKDIGHQWIERDPRFDQRTQLPPTPGRLDQPDGRSFIEVADHRDRLARIDRTLPSDAPECEQRQPLPGETVKADFLAGSHSRLEARHLINPVIPIVLQFRETDHLQTRVAVRSSSFQRQFAQPAARTA